MRKQFTLMATLGALAAGCGGTGLKLPSNQPVQSTVALTAFNSCLELKKYIEDTATLQMRAELETYRNGGPRMYMVDEAGPRAEGAKAASSGPSSFTTTNTQVRGVDEADFVKNDGTRIFTLSGNTLYANRSWPAAELAQTAALTIEGWPQQMFLEGNRVLVFSSVYWQLPFAQSYGCALGWSCGYQYGNVTKLTAVDVTDPAHLVVTGEQYLPGYYGTSRRVGSAVRVVLRDQFNYPSDVSLWLNVDANVWNDKVALGKAIDSLEASNEKNIRKQPLEAWIPKGKRRLADGTLVDVSYNCSDFVKSNTPAKMGIVTVATVSLDTPDQVAARTSILTAPGVVYASESSLYIASNHWWWWFEDGQDNTTYIHKFDLSDATKVSYVGSGVITGDVRDQFSLDESNGKLRVVSSTAHRVVSDAKKEPWGHLVLGNRVNVFSPGKNSLMSVGRSEDISPGEWLTAARFVGDHAFLVTYKYTDPFTTVDLSDPAHPHVVGSLEVPGFSTYIQAVDATHLLTMGIENGMSTEESLRVSLYDVTDFAHPKRSSSIIVGTGWSWSEALWDHHAFNYYAEKGLLAIPFFDWGTSGDYWNSFVSDLRVLRVDPVNGLSTVGNVNFSDVYQQFNYPNWTYYWTPMVRRSVMADDFVYAISDAGIRVANLAALGTPLATSMFTPLKPSN